MIASVCGIECQTAGDGMVESERGAIQGARNRIGEREDSRQIGREKFRLAAMTHDRGRN